MFRDAKVGDRVWSVKYGWFCVEKIRVECRSLNLRSEENHSLYNFYWDGKENINDSYPTLFWDEVKITPPPKPKRKVKKVIEGWISIFRHRDGAIKIGGILNRNPLGPGSTVLLPDGCTPSSWYFLGENFIRHEYEVEE